MPSCEARDCRSTSVRGRMRHCFSEEVIATADNHKVSENVRAGFSAGSAL